MSMDKKDRKPSEAPIFHLLAALVCIAIWPLVRYTEWLDARWEARRKKSGAHDA